VDVKGDQAILAVVCVFWQAPMARFPASTSTMSWVCW
jgi:hypothetical protein